MNKEKKTKVMIIGTMHGFHMHNELYSYEDIFKIIEEFKPEVLGVEIRKEDMEQPREFLKRYYPYEMIEAAFRFRDKAKVYGFDYYEKDMEGKIATDEYLKNLEKPILDKKFDEDVNFEKERKLMDIINYYKLDLVKSSTSKELNGDKYDVANYIYYNQRELLFKDTIYEKISTFDKERDKHIDENIINIIKENFGKKLAFVMGCDHRVFAINAIKESLADEVEILNTL